MHRLLARQLRKHLGIDGDIPEDLRPLIQAVDQAYQQFDDDRRLMEHAMELSSSELTDKNQKLKELLELGETAKQTMRQARDEAENANRHKSEFLANMSHEIRTPLNAILGMSNLLIELDQTEQQRDYTQSILSSGESLLAIINDVLDFSKIEAGELQIDVHTFDLHQVVEGILDVFGFQCAQKGIEISLLIDPKVPRYAEGDSTRIRQVLINLVGNAIKFTSEGGVRIAVDCTSEDSAQKLLFSVRDTGIGIPQDRIDGMFDSFTQADASISRKFGGTGLGLAICKSLVLLMDGTLAVDSELGVGSCFTFSIGVGFPDGAGKKPDQLNVLGTDRFVVALGSSITSQSLLEQLQSWGLPAESLGDRSLALGNMPSYLIVDAIDSSRFLEAKPYSKFIVVEPITGDSSSMDSGSKFQRVKSPVKPSELHRAIQILNGSLQSTPRNRTSGESDEKLAVSLPMEILVAEDNPTNRKLIRLILEREGYQSVTLVNDGREALEAMQSTDFDLVFMDLQMPELDGLEATRELRKTVPLAEPPYVLALTANASTRDFDICIEAGMHGFLSKPIRKSDLKLAMAEAYRWIANARRRAG